ncbi:MAG TPA: hypothetical protein VK737_02180 [Opitutales bacterium]|jgi:hypothetical protein|nr:hypothetical protein [Opitutales bacterium]
MSAKSPEQKRAFEFLLARYNNQELFTKAEMEAAAGWNPQKNSFNTYWTKQFRPLVIEHDEKFRVSQLFKRYSTWPKFRDNIVTQNRVLSSNYSSSTYDQVVVFEFFMPLRNEEHLRATLDTLFFRNIIVARLKILDQTDLAKNFPKKVDESDAPYYERICDWISDTFAGYSIRHVNGRYRAGSLRSKEDAARSEAKGEPYLIDETTAVTTFIIPYGKPIAGHFFSNNQEDSLDFAESPELSKIRWFFYHLFIQSIIEVVNGEDEIWLLENGRKSALHIWKNSPDREEGGE